MSAIDLIWVVFLRFGGWGLLLVLAGYYLTHPEKLFLLSGKVTKFLSLFFSRFKKTTVSNKLRGSILGASKQIAHDCPSIAPFDLKIQWVKSESKETFLNGNTIIVRMNENDRMDHNMVYAVHAYAKSGFVPYARAFIAENANSAINMVLTKRILMICSGSSLHAFYEEIYSIYRKDPRVDQLFCGLIQADNNGIFTRIFLNELSKLSYVLKELVPSEAILKEIEGFTEYVIAIANREMGELTPLVFQGNFIKIAVVLPSSADYYKEKGASVLKISRSFFDGCKTVYILAIGSKIELARNIDEVIKANDEFICVSKSAQYKHIFRNGQMKTGICIELQPVTISEEANA